MTEDEYLERLQSLAKELGDADEKECKEFCEKIARDIAELYRTYTNPDLDWKFDSLYNKWVAYTNKKRRNLHYTIYLDIKHTGEVSFVLRIPNHFPDIRCANFLEAKKFANEFEKQ